jgi:hypothetical protein
MCGDKNAVRNHYIKFENTSFERVEEFKYVGTNLTNQNTIQEKFKSRLKLGNVCYYSVQNLLSCSFLSKKLKMKIYRPIILPFVLLGCETCSLTFREGLSVKLYENVVLRGIFWLEGDS